MQIPEKEYIMDNSYDLMKIYGIPPAPYSEDNPDDLFLDNLPSLEQIAMYNLSLNQSYRNKSSISPQNPSETSISSPFWPIYFII